MSILERANWREYIRLKRLAFPRWGRSSHDIENEYARLRRLAFPEIFRVVSTRSKRKLRYGLTDNDYKNLVKTHKGKCAICRTKHKKMCIDHCHNQNKVRGYLCDQCNKLLGCAKDDISILKAAIKYLRKHA